MNVRTSEWKLSAVAFFSSSYRLV